MKNSGWLLAASIVLAGSAVVGLRAQKAPAAPSAEMQAMTEAHRKAIEPGPQHLDLMRLAGEYTTRDTFYMPGAETPVTSQGAATIKNEMGGRFLVEHNNGVYMDEPYAGLRIYGFNNGSKQYEGVWTYSASTGVMNLSGTSKDGAKSLDFTANFKDDATGQAMSMAVTLKTLDPDHFQVELKSTMPNGSAGLRVVTTYTRKI